MQRRLVLLLSLVISWAVEPAEAELICAGSLTELSPTRPGALAKPSSAHHMGERRALVLFAGFESTAAWATIPEWGAQLLDPSVPGSLSHFYDTMSFGALRVRGEPAPGVYRVAGTAADYVSADPTIEGGYERFCREVIELADADVDYSRFDSDGPDGVPNSGDDDGIVDVVFILVERAPERFILGPATGVGRLGEWDDLTTHDMGSNGTPVRVSAFQGTLQQGATFAEAAGAMCHEFGHVLGLPDLYNTDYLLAPGAPPEEDSAGIGAWGLMGWGAHGWGDAPGPNSLCAWSRMRLGWADVVEFEGDAGVLELEQVGAAGQIARVPLAAQEYLLLEYRRRSSTYYDRAVPGEGLLIWHVRRAEYEGETSPYWDVDLECADGLWADAGYPLGHTADPQDGEDNLDFWAHDAEYALAHGGNLGDGTDPYDGERYGSFTPETNPAATSSDGLSVAYVEDIRLDGDLLQAQVRMGVPVVVLYDVVPQAEPVAAGSGMAITFHVANRGAVPATNLRVELSTTSEVLEIVDPVLPLRPLQAGQTSMGAGVSETGFPRVRFAADLAEESVAEVEVMLLAGEVELARDTTEVTGVPAHPVTVSVTDSSGVPLAGISVSLTGPWGNQASEAHYEDSACTDSAGQAAFGVTAGVYSLNATPRGDSLWGAAWLGGVWIDRARAYTISLPRMYTLTGVLSDEEGRPVAGQELVADWSVGGYGHADIWPIGTDGTFSVKLPAGVVRLSTRPQVAGAAIPPQDHGALQLGGDTHVDLVVRAGVPLTVEVADEEGVPIDGVAVSAALTIRQYGAMSVGVTSLGEGATLAVMPGVYTVQFGTVPDPSLPIPPLSRLVVRADTTVEVMAHRGWNVRVQLAETDGAAYALPRDARGGLSFVSLDGGLGGRAYLARGGSYATACLGRGRYRVQLQTYPNPDGPGRAPPSQTLGVVEVLGDTVVSLPVQPGVSVEGVVRGGLGGAWNRLQWQGRGGECESVYLNGDGSFALRLMCDEYEVRVTSNDMGMGWPDQSLGRVSIVGDTVLAWDWVEGELFHGRVTDADGRGIPQLEVTAAATTGGRYVSNSYYTEHDGSFTMRLPEGRYGLRAHQGYLRTDEVTWDLGSMDVPQADVQNSFALGGSVLNCSAVDGDGHRLRASIHVDAAPFDLSRHLRAVTEGAGQVQAVLRTEGPLCVSVQPGRYSAVMTPDEEGVAPFSRVVPELVVEGELDVVLAQPAPAETVLLTGSVGDARGTVSDSVRLLLYAAERELLVPILGLGGRYAVRLPQGRYQAAASRCSPGWGCSYYHLDHVVVKGDSVWDVVLGNDTAVAGDGGSQPQRFVLEPNYPNPFNPSTTIGYELAAPVEASLTIYNCLGQRVCRLIDARQEAGRHSARWDGRTDSGMPVSSGVYVYRLVAGEQFEACSRMLLLR